MPDITICEHGPADPVGCFTCADATDRRDGGHIAWQRAIAYWDEQRRTPAIAARQANRTLPTATRWAVMERQYSAFFQAQLGQLAARRFSLSDFISHATPREGVGYSFHVAQTQRRAAMPTYPQSLDPNVPGDGRPLRVGDRVQHIGARNQPAGQAIVAEVVSVDPRRPQLGIAGIRVTRETAGDVHGFATSTLGAWSDTEWQLMQRPQPVSGVDNTASLDPTVPGTGRPFQRGDIVRFLSDPADGRSDAQVLSLSGNNIKLRGFGSAAKHFNNASWGADYFRLVKRPSAAEGYLMPPAVYTDGYAGEYPDEEFVQGIAAWFQRIRTGSGVPRSDVFWHNDQHGSPLSTADGIYALCQFLSGVNGDVAPVRMVSDYLYLPFRTNDTLETVTRMVRVTLTQLMNAHDPTLTRCESCAVVGQYNPSGSAACAHFYCSSCGQTKTGAHCTTCEGLLQAENEDPGHFTCIACCAHTVCTEPGFEETMLKKDQCPTCKRGPKFCKCPGCEKKGCKARKIQPCCGHCEGHCSCETTCMQHTGMLPLHKFYAPPEEKGMTRLLGTEIETYGSRILQYTPTLRKAVKAWEGSVISDGSIGGRGVELVTQPAGGSQWRQMIADYGAGFAESQSITKPTCGLHVHVDCTDVFGHELKRIIRLYNLLEFCLYDALPMERQTGTYSVPNGKKLIKWLENDAAKFDAKMAAEESKKRMAYIHFGQVPTGGKMPKVGETYSDLHGTKRVMSTTTVQQLTSQWDQVVLQNSRGKSHSTRYSGLNMQSYFLRGTLEFRMHHGTNDPVKITNWGFVVGSIVDYCVKHTDEDMDLICALEPRLAMAMVLEGQDDVMKWLETRWNKFTSAHNVRLPTQPDRDPLTGEV